MNYRSIAWFIFLDSILSTASSTIYSRNVTINCSADSQQCGPAPLCCPSGFKCIDDFGTPLCKNPNEYIPYGFDHDPCNDPYTFRCDEVIPIPGFCCPIGTSCLVDNDKAVSCVNALGATKSAVPSTATDFIPLSTPIAGSNVGIVYSPPGAWSDQNSTSDCATSSSLHVTSTINASISVNYTGTSIMVNTMTSSDGGVFSVIINGFDTMSFVDTYSGPGNLSLPICYPLQFPPFYVQPPEYANRTSHTLELLFIGVSPLAPNGTNTSIGQLGVFAIPNLNPPTSNGSSNVMKNLKVSSLVLAFFYFLLDM